MKHDTGQQQKSPQTAKTLFLCALALIALWSLLVDRHHAHSWVEQHIPFFWSFFAFLAGSAILLMSKWLTMAGLKENEGTYDFPLGKVDEEKP